MWISDSVSQAIGWTLVHFVWQGAAVAAITVLVLAALRCAGAGVRYGVACAGLLIMAALPILTLSAMLRSQPDDMIRSAGTAETGAVVESGTAAPDNASAHPLSQFDAPGDLRPWLRVAVFFWISGVTILTARMLAAWLVVQRVRRAAAAAGNELRAAAAVAASRLRMTRPVQILESALITVPSAAGIVWPAILWPAGLWTSLSPAQIEAIIAHELAHIRRFDYFVNVLQTAVETLLFYHPAVWIVSGRIRIEREHCCDDLAVAACGDRLAYIEALASLEELRSDRTALVLGANGGGLLNRVQRLLGGPVTHDRRDPVWVLIGIAAVILAIVGGPGEATFPSRPEPAVSPEVAAAPASPAPLAQNRPPIEPAVSERRWSWTGLGARHEIRWRGSFMLAPDNQDFDVLSPDGYFRLSQVSLRAGERTIELRGRPDGAIERKYFAEGREQPYDPAGKAWLADVLPRAVRRSGFAADAQVAKILTQSGAPAVLSEISQLQTDSVRAAYFKEFFEQAKPAGPLLAEALEQAARQMSSSYELAEVLIAVGTTVPADSPAWDAYFDAADSLESSFEHRRVLSALAEAGLSENALSRMIRSANAISSNMERATALVRLSERNKLNSRLRDVYLEGTNGIASKHERSRATEALERSGQ